MMSRRAGIAFEGDLASDSAPLTSLVRAMLAAGEVRCLRDATRGGVASVLNELAEASGVSMTVEEGAVPVLGPVKAACEMLGLDPLYVANEGVAVAIVAPEERTAAAGAANVVRLASWAVAPLAAGMAMSHLSIAAPLVIGAAIKIGYDVLLYLAFRRVRTPEEIGPG